MARKRGQLIPKGRGKWLARVYIGRDADGERQYTSKLVEGTRTAAREELDRMLAERANGRLVVAPARLAVGEWADQWLATVVEPSCRKRTYHDYHSVLDRYIRPHLATVPLRRLRAAGIRAWIAELRAAGLGSRTVRQAHEVCRNMLEAAVRDGLIVDNPARSSLVRKALPAREQKDRHTIGAEDLARFLEAVNDDPLAPYWLIFLFAGTRPEETLALRWRDISGDTIRIERVLVDRAGIELHFESPKSAMSRRAVVVPPVVTDALKEHRTRQLERRLAAGPDWKDEDLVFPNESGGARRQSTLRAAWRSLLERAELPSMRPYDLRHSCASLLLAAGENIKTIQERLGHADVSMTLRTYAHARETE